MSIIDFDNARYTYDGHANALDGMNLRVQPGEFICVLGGNGSGKSTLAKHVNALFTPDSGSVTVLGCDTRNAEHTYFIRSNVGMVFQNPDDQIVASVIENDVAFGPENLGIPADELRERVTDALTQVGLQGFEKRETASLSGGQKQRVALAGVLAMEPQVLVLDEASAMLDPRGRAGLLRLCRELNASGLTVILITHFMEEAARADRVIVLEGGKVALDGAPGDVLTQVERLASLHLSIPFATQMSYELQERGVALPPVVELDDLAEGIRVAAGRRNPRWLTQGEPDSQANQAGQTGQAGQAARETAAKPLISLSDVSFTYQQDKKAVSTQATPAKWGNAPDNPWALKDVSLSIMQGEFFGIAGHTGSGKSTLIQLAAGLLQPTAGSVAVNGVDLANKRLARTARSTVGVVFQYPERQLFAATVFDDVAFGPRNLGLSAEAVEERVRAALDAVHLNVGELRDKSPFALSGGQQRRVAFAGVLAMEPQVLVLDEPTAGLDPQARATLLRLVTELHDEQGLTIVFVSHNMDDLAQLCDRIAILNQGQLVALGAPEDVFADAEALRGIGLGIPQVLQLMRALDMPLPKRIPTASELADDIAGLIDGQANHER